MKTRETLLKENMELRVANKGLRRLIDRTNKMEAKFKQELMDKLRQEATCRHVLLDGTKS